MAKLKTKYPPPLTIDESIKIIREISENYGSEPVSLDLFPQILNTSRKSSFFERKIATLRKYGLIEYMDNNRINISLLGLQIIKPTELGESEKAIKQSVLKIDLIDELLKRYPSGNLPDDETFSNILLREYNIPPKNIKGWILYISLSFRALKVKQETKESNEIIKPESNSIESIEKDSVIMQLPMNSGSMAKIIIPKDATQNDIEKIKKMLGIYWNIEDKKI